MMRIVGLTGSIGMGKSTAAAVFRDFGIAVFDADAEVHRLYQGPLSPAIEAAFPGSVVDGVVDRSKLSAELMANSGKFALLERIVHPAVRSAQRAFLLESFAQNRSIAVLEIPLLFESGGDANVDCVVVVSAPAELQRARVMARHGMTDEKFAELLSRQTSDAEKIRRSDFVVDTSGRPEACRDAIAKLIPVIESRPARAFEMFWR